MKVLLINGTKRRQTTYNVAKKFISKLGENVELEELFLPDAMPKFCTGCGTCFLLDEKKCPHYEYTKEILSKILWCDIIVFASPVYVYHTTGQIKTLLDHFAFMWMIHRPNTKMFKKQAVIITTAAGGGNKSTIKDISDSMYYWGIKRVHSLGVNVRAVKYNEVGEKILKIIDIKTSKLAKKVLRGYKSKKVCFKSKSKYYLFKNLHKHINLNENDKKYWVESGLINHKPF